MLEEEGRPGRGGRAGAAFQEDGVTLTEPSLLLALHLDGEAEVGQLDGGALAFTRQQQVLWLREEEKTEPCEALAYPSGPEGASCGRARAVPPSGTRWRQHLTSRKANGESRSSTFRSLWTMSCWWMWLTLSRIWCIQWLQKQKEEKCPRGFKPPPPQPQAVDPSTENLQHGKSLSSKA